MRCLICGKLLTVGMSCGTSIHNKLSLMGWFEKVDGEIRFFIGPEGIKYSLKHGYTPPQHLIYSEKDLRKFNFPDNPLGNK